MTRISDDAIEHLRRAASLPDLSGTRYELIELAGRGGMAAVYRAHDSELERDVALKVLSVPEVAPDAAARLLREARTLATLEHPGIIPVHDVGTLPDGRVFYTMKLVRGERLDEHVRASASRAELLRIFGRICEAVAFAHAQGVVHRDLKPENIMVGPFGEVLVMDWGIAKLLDGASSAPAKPAAHDPSGAESAITGHGTVLGTPGYMAPEQARGAVDEVDERADVYSLGAILDYMLREARRASADGARVPRPLAAIAARAMAPEREARYPAVAALSADIERFGEGLPVSAYTEGILERAQRLFRKYRVPILLIAAYLVVRVLLLLIAGV
ncbi:MAG TPA: serine/threonine-protein kinase [Gemmatimonadaceae bacterium]|nr:serine/threonine-protein kinase [Gemmatimonadaceae bacterium]